MSQVEAVDATVVALGARALPEHAALIEACRGIAEGLDDRPTAALWHEYLSAVTSLIQLGAEIEAEDDGQASLLELVRTPVRDTKKPGKRNARSGGSGGGRTAGSTVDAVATAGRGRRPRTS